MKLRSARPAGCRAGCRADTIRCGCSLLRRLSEDLLVTITAQTPLLPAHPILRAVNRTLRKLLRSSRFAAERVTSGSTETALVAIGGHNNFTASPFRARVWVLLSLNDSVQGPWRELSPLPFGWGLRRGISVANPKSDEVIFIGGNTLGSCGICDQHQSESDCEDCDDNVTLYNDKTLSPIIATFSTKAGWRKRLNLQQPREFAAAVIFDNTLVIIGGRALCSHCMCGTVATETVETINLDDWTHTGVSTIPPLPHEVTSPIAGVIAEELFVFGGCLLWGLDTVTNSWTEKATMPSSMIDDVDGDYVPIEHAAGAVFEGKFYIIGGTIGDTQDAYETVRVYDPKSDSWSLGAPLPFPCDYCQATVHEGALIVVGDGGPPLKLDASAEAWAPLHSFSTMNCHSCALASLKMG